MNILQYDETALRDELARMSNKSRVAFAVACAERMFPVYEEFCKKSGKGELLVLSGILERIWQHVFGEEMDAALVAEALRQSMLLIPSEEDEGWMDERECAEDEVSAICYTLRAIEKHDPKEAVWAARRVYEAVDAYVEGKLGIEDESMVLAHPLVQREFARQRRDVAELLAVQDDLTLLMRLRDRAKSEAFCFDA